MIVRDAAFAAVLTLGDTEVVGGYAAIDGYDEGQRTWRRITVDAPRVDSSFDVARARSKQRLTLLVLVEGATAAEARSRHRALLAAVEADSWFLDVTGDGSTAVWSCDAADESASPQYFDGGLVRVLSFSIPADPTFGF